MAVAALVALLNDLIITCGIRPGPLRGHPGTGSPCSHHSATALRHRGGVFDKVRENTGALTAMSRTTYSQATNLAVNQTMMRSLNTSLASLLPILGLLLVGSYLLGAETLDLALALFRRSRRRLLLDLHRPADRGHVEGEGAPLRPAPGPGRAPGRPGPREPSGPSARSAGAGGTRARRAAAPPPEPELLPSLGALPDDELEETEAQAEEEAVVAQAPACRQPQKPRPTQQAAQAVRRQQSRPAKRRRR